MEGSNATTIFLLGCGLVILILAPVFIVLWWAEKEREKAAEGLESIVCYRCNQHAIAKIKGSKYWCSSCNYWLLSENDKQLAEEAEHRDEQEKVLADQQKQRLEQEKTQKQEFKASRDEVYVTSLFNNNDRNVKWPSICACCGSNLDSYNVFSYEVTSTATGRLGFATVTQSKFKISIPLCLSCKPQKVLLFYSSKTMDGRKLPYLFAWGFPASLKLCNVHKNFANAIRKG